MTTYRSVASTETDPYAPIVAQLMKALALNPFAITEGSAGAPRIMQPAMGAWYATAGGIGTYVFATSTTAADVGYGATISGSALFPISAAYKMNNPFNIDTDGSFIFGPALSGTWQCMGSFDYQTADLDSDPAGARTAYWFGATLWLRIA